MLEIHVLSLLQMFFEAVGGKMNVLFIIAIGSVAKNKKGGAPLYFSGQILKCQILSGVISVGS
jgi:hypothetical protein